MLAGFEAPSSGRIEIDGQDMARVPPWRRPVNMMFQSYALFPHMTVAGNVAFGLRQDDVPRAEIRRRVQDALELVRLRDLADRRPDRLSGGQRQRVALARAVVKRPKLLLLDEPLAALDRRLREATQLELVAIQRTLGITFVIVTHDQEEAMTVSTRMAIMNAGRAVQIGPPAEIYERPATRFVAEFVGRTNMVEARVIEAGERLMRLAAPGLGCEIVTDRPVPASVGDAVWAAIRPEAVELTTAAAPADGGANRVRGRVSSVAYLGDLSVYHVLLPTGVTIRASATNRNRPAERPAGRDDEVWLSWRPDASVVLRS
jgi:putrescine transport system ATP-binding protein